MGIELATGCEGSQASRQMRGSRKPDVGGSLRCLGPVARRGELRTKAKRKAGGLSKESRDNHMGGEGMYAWPQDGLRSRG